MAHKPWRLFLLLLCALLALSPNLALSQEGFKDAKTALSTGRKLVEQGQFQEAYTTFQQGYTQFKDPEFIFFSADALLKLQKYQESKDAFERYLQLQPKSKNKKDIDNIIAELVRILSIKITIKSSPNGASLWIDDQFGPPKGTTPMTISMPPGTHTAILQKKGFGITRQTFEVSEGKALTLDIKLDDEPVTLKISSDPKGAEIFLDGSSIGVTPYEGEISAGKHSIALKKAGYGTANISINERPGKTITLSEKLPPPPGIVLFSNIEAKATITIDDKTSPLTERVEFTPGEHTFTLEAPGFRSRTEKIQVSTGKELLINAKLLPVGVSLLVASNIPGATLLVNGKAIGQTPMNSSVFIPSGDRPTIRVEKDGFKPYEKKLSKKDGDFNLNVDLQQEGKLPLGPTAIVATGAAVTTSGAVFGLLTLREDARLQALPPGTNPSQGELDALRLKSNLSTIGISAGPAVLVIGTLWLRSKGGLTRSPGKLKEASISPTKNGAVASLSF